MVYTYLSSASPFAKPMLSFSSQPGREWLLPQENNIPGICVASSRGPHPPPCSTQPVYSTPIIPSVSAESKHIMTGRETKKPYQHLPALAFSLRRDVGRIAYSNSYVFHAVKAVTSLLGMLCRFARSPFDSFGYSPPWYSP